MESFSRWYQRLHGYEPFPWQVRLAQSIQSGQPPDNIVVPTGLGKSVMIAVWLWAIEHQCAVPKRLFFAIDRRLLVDSVTLYADELIQKLGIEVQLAQLRGGKTPDDGWMMQPNQPALVVSTIDQIGSRLLFRGYGVSDRVAPIHAALTGNDAYIVLDEAHIASPFLTTLRRVKSLRVRERLPFWVTAMTATPQVSALADDSASLLSLNAEDHRHPLVQQRLSAEKRALLAKTQRQGFCREMVKQALHLRNDKGADVIGVICNRASDARRVFETLSSKGNSLLMTGRVRETEREQILREWLPTIQNGSRHTELRQPVFVVTTQTIEVGADLDFDALVTQSAPIATLCQRFGRLNRAADMSRSWAVIVHENLTSKEDCFIYGKKALKASWSWLGKVASSKGHNKWVDFGLRAIEQTLTEHPFQLEEMEPSLTLTPQLLRRLRQTLPAAPVDITPLLHGDQQDNRSVFVVWRADLTDANHQHWPAIAQAAPPVMAETVACPLYAVRQWLRQRRCLIYRAGCALDKPTRAATIRLGDVVVVPSFYGGYDQWGWNAQSQTEVSDVGNRYSKWIRLIGADSDQLDQALLNEKNRLMSIGNGLDQSRTREWQASAGIFAITTPVATPYPAGLVVRNANRRVKHKTVKLDDHLRGCAAMAKTLTDDPIIIEAAKEHDIGKRDPRFQMRLGKTDEDLAKSAHRSLIERAQAERFCGLPTGWRHEVYSVALLPDNADPLLRYLVATHHGYARTLLPLNGDAEQWAQLGGARWAGVSQQLNDTYGVWGLAYQEALVRLADWLQSKKEQEAAAT